MVEFLERIADSVYLVRNPIPIPALKYVNTYIVGDRDCFTVIDPGLGEKSAKQIRAALKETGFREERIEAIILTHFHVDHSTAAGFLAEGKTVYMGEKDLELIESIGAGINLVDEIELLFYYSGMPEKEVMKIREKHPAFSRTRLFERLLEKHDFIRVGDGFSIDLCGASLKVIEVPGHTPGHIALILEGERLAFVGDHILSNITPNIPLLFWNSNLLADYLNSLERVAKLNVGAVLPGHRSIIVDYKRRVEELFEHHAARLAEILQILVRKEEATAYAIASHMKWDVPYKSWADFPLSQKYFAVAEALSHLRYLLDKGLVEVDLKRDAFVFRLAERSLEELKHRNYLERLLILNREKEG